MAQNTARKHSGALVPQRRGGQDGLGWWGAPYVQPAVTTRLASPQVQHRDVGLFLRSLQCEQGTNERLAPRLARPFQPHLRQPLTPAGHRAWSDKTLPRILAPLKTFAPWVHTHQPCPLGHPIAALTRSALGTGLEVDRVLPAAACRRLRAVAALLLVLDALDDAATAALRRAVRGTTASGGGGEGRDTSPHMALDMANHLHYWCGAWLRADDRPWV